VDRGALTERVSELAEPLALAVGLELIDVQYRPEGGRLVLRILLDRPQGGVTLDELARFSRELSDLLDGHDAVPGRYHLECSSPGLNRPLLREAHFRRALGQRVRIRTRTPLDDRRQFRGKLEEVTTEGVRVSASDATNFFIPFAAIDRANVEYDFTRPSHAPA
jgi:ribosome maturation factor RimP